LDVNVPEPTHVRIELSGASRPLFDAKLDKTGTFLVDPTRPGATVALTVDGPWTARFRGLDTLSTYGLPGELSGHGPEVVVLPGGSSVSVSARFTSSTKGSHFQLVGRCHVPDCPDERAGELPIGLEALVVNDPGDWSVIPQHIDARKDAVRLSDLR
jgi:hypothetical protein